MRCPLGKDGSDPADPKPHRTPEPLEETCPELHQDWGRFSDVLFPKLSLSSPCKGAPQAES